MHYMHLSPASLNQAIRLLEQPVAAESSAWKSRGEQPGREHLRQSEESQVVEWRPHRDSNSGYRRERAVSWASRRWGLFRAAPDTMPAAERPARRLALAGEPGRVLLRAEHPGAAHARLVAEQQRYCHQRQVE